MTVEELLKDPNFQRKVASTIDNSIDIDEDNNGNVHTIIDPDIAASNVIDLIKSYLENPDQLKFVFSL